MEEDFPMNSTVFGNRFVLSVSQVGALSLSNLEIPFTSIVPHAVLSVRKLADGVKYGFRIPMHPLVSSGNNMMHDVNIKTRH